MDKSLVQINTFEGKSKSLTAIGSSGIGFTSPNLSSRTINCSMHVVNGSTMSFKKMALWKRSFITVPKAKNY